MGPRSQGWKTKIVLEVPHGILLTCYKTCYCDVRLFSLYVSNVSKSVSKFACLMHNVVWHETKCKGANNNIFNTHTHLKIIELIALTTKRNICILHPPKVLDRILLKKIVSWKHFSDFLGGCKDCWSETNLQFNVWGCLRVFLSVDPVYKI